jgi:hypothetical protein
MREAIVSNPSIVKTGGLKAVKSTHIRAERLRITADCTRGFDFLDVTVLFFI